MKQYEFLAEVLKNIGLLSEDQIRKAVKEHKNLQERIGQILVRLGFIPQENLDQNLLAQFGIFPSSLEEAEILKDWTTHIPQDLITHHRTLLVKRKGDKTIVLVTDQPYNLL